MISPEMLRRFPCFAGLKEETIKALSMISQETCVRAGTQIFVEGESAKVLSIIIDGEVDIEYSLDNGQRRVVDTLVRNDLLGWSALIEPHQMTGAATASTEVRLVTIDAPQLRAICEQDPLLGYRLLVQICRLLADRLEGARVQLATV